VQYRLFSLFRDATLTFPERSIQTTVPIKFAKFTRDELSKILPENGQNIVVWRKLFPKFLSSNLFFFRIKKHFLTTYMLLNHMIFNLLLILNFKFHLPNLIMMERVLMLMFFNLNLKMVFI